jgi:hypothetical protein
MSACCGHGHEPHGSYADSDPHNLVADDASTISL